MSLKRDQLAIDCMIHKTFRSIFAKVLGTTEKLVYKVTKRVKRTMRES